jgi:replication factor C subunit 3/5
MNCGPSDKPWIEKYRPTKFDEIVLDPVNRRLFINMIESNMFPHLLFYGPPGTGKTTTIINLIKEYQRKRGITNSGNIIHLNASDERGIDIIRNQIHQFVGTKNLFDVGMKFVILDEVDYMTKNAQQALKELLLSTTAQSVRFCLICNYISKIDMSLQHEFICIRFNQLPREDIFSFIRYLAAAEGISLSDSTIDKIHRMYNSDIRSMINFIQSGSGAAQTSEFLSPPLDSGVAAELLERFKGGGGDKLADASGGVRDFVVGVSHRFGCDVRHIMRHFFDYVIRSSSVTLEGGGGAEFLERIEPIVHNQDGVPVSVLLDYFLWVGRVTFGKGGSI